jgi:16S rRNA (guanine(966)-N(2))-methyltransferase RsmD
MQILAGKFRHQHLVGSPSPKVRPTARRLREALFLELGDKIRGARFLDMCAGSGAVGLEALSRGAAHATFVERSPRFAAFVQRNLGSCRIGPQAADLIIEDGEQYLRRAARRHRHWDIAFLDPPYDADYMTLMTLLAEGDFITPDGDLIAEHPADKPLPEKVGDFACHKRVAEGESCLSFYRRARR